MRNAFLSIYEQHTSEAAFLWMLWRNATIQPQQNKESLAQIETRIFNHIAGLMVKPEVAWDLAAQALSFDEPGEAFTAAQIAFRSYKLEWIKHVVDYCVDNANSYEGLVSALNWLPGDVCHPWLKRFFESKALSHKILALDVCITRDEDPGAYLAKLCEREDCVSDPAFLNSALKCIGNFKRSDLDSFIDGQVEQNNFMAIRAAVLLGNETAVEKLKTFVFARGCFQQEAISIAFRVLPNATARKWISELAQKPDFKREVIKATGLLGDPHALSWLLTTMQAPEYARLAANAFSKITGLEIQDSQYAQESPYSLDEAIEMDGIELDEEEHLPWPNVQALNWVWKEHYSKKLTPGQRYFNGLVISNELLKQVLKQGFQPARIAAAYELACNATYRFVNVCGRQTARV